MVDKNKQTFLGGRRMELTELGYYPKKVAKSQPQKPARNRCHASTCSSVRPCLLRWWKEHERFPALFDPDRVSLPNSPAMKHGGIDTNIDLIVLGRCPQNTGIMGQVCLRQRRHHTAGARACDTEANLIADGERVANPCVLNEVLHAAGGLHDDVGTELKRVRTDTSA